MKQLRIIFVITALTTVFGLMFWLAVMPQTEPADGVSTFDHAHDAVPGALRLALVPERNIFEQRARYQALVDELSDRIGQPIELVTLNTYDRVLNELSENRIDAAFVGSMVAVLAYDRLGVRIVAKPEMPGGIDSYRGVIFVRDDSPIYTIDELNHHSISAVRATTAGDLYPIYLLHEHGMIIGREQLEIRWVGTHDDVILEVMAGRADAGAVKNLRLDDWHREHADQKIRRIATSDAVPNNALIVRRDVDVKLVGALRTALLSMNDNEVGRAALAKFGAVRFVDCSIGQYEAFYQMSQALGDAWSQLGVNGPAPKPLSAAAGTGTGDP